MRVLVVHGGAGAWQAADAAAAREGVRRAAVAGREQLAGGSSALEAVAAAVCVLEDDPLFNAGTGSCLDAEGNISMDASIMRGHDRGVGGVAALRDVRHPVLVARAVLETTEHVLLGGEGALRFARAHGFDAWNPESPARRAAWERRRADPAGGSGDPPPGTVGAVALDDRGRLAAATSTGGLTRKLPGRIGDSPIPGAGNYATDRAAASLTGHGEYMLRLLSAAEFCHRVAQGAAPAAAAAETLDSLRAAFGPGGAGTGIIGVDRAGGVGVAHGTPAMPHAVWRSGEPLRAAFACEDPDAWSES